MELALFKPNNLNYSETFIDAHIAYLPEPKYVLYDGFFPARKPDGSFLIESKLGILSYLIQKRILKKKNIPIRNRYLLKYLKQKKIEVALAEYGPTGALISDVCKKSNIPMVVYFFGFDAHNQNTITEYLPLYKKMFKDAYRIVGISHYMVNELIRLGCPQEKAVFIPCGVRTDFFSPSNVIESGPVFLSVARFAEKKGPFQLLEAFQKVLKQVPGARLIMAGVGPLWEPSKKYAAELGIEAAVDFKGIVSQEGITELMKKARAFVQHSLTAPNGDMEGTPLSILEASSAALPIVSTRHAGIVEAVVEGKTGLLVDEMDVEGMSRNMLLFAKDAGLAAEMGKNARKHIQENYDVRNTIKQLADLLRQAAEPEKLIKPKTR